MFSKFLRRVKAVPPRGADWAGHLGPVALFGLDGAVPRSARALTTHFVASPKDADFPCALSFTDAFSQPLEAPPETALLMPVLNLGEMAPDEASGSAATPDDWHVAAHEAAADLYERGFTPLVMGGDGSELRALVEGYKRVHPDDELVVLHLGARSGVGAPGLPLRTLLEKKRLQGVIHIGGRCISAECNRVRRELEVRFCDMFHFFGNGIFAYRNIRNDFPVFINLHIDALDPAVAPGVRDPVSGGMTARELLHLLRGLRGPRIAGVLLHGYDPALDVVRGDGLGMTLPVTSKVAKEAVVKIYSTSTMTEEEAAARVKAQMEA